MIYENASPAPSPPGFQLDQLQIRNEMRGNDIKTFGSHPTLVGSILLRSEFSGEICAHLRTLRHLSLPDFAIVSVIDRTNATTSGPASCTNPTMDYTGANTFALPLSHFQQLLFMRESDMASRFSMQPKEAVR
jgi:hypothetical protein